MTHRPDDVVSGLDAIINKEESQFKYHCPDVRSSVKEIADSTSTVRTSTSHGPDVRIADMEIAC